MKYSLDYSFVKFEMPNPGDAGYDIRSAEYLTIYPKEKVRVKTGLHLEIPTDGVGIIKDRSSMAAKGVYTHGGVIDSSYRGEILVLLSNESDELINIVSNDKIAQLVIVSYIVEGLVRVTTDQLSETKRASDGFGSTGTQ